MFEKGKRESRHSEDDKVFNRMLLWLVGAVVVELLLLLLRKAYVEMIFGATVAIVLRGFFQVFSFVGAAAVVGCAAWAVVNYRAGRPMTQPLAIAGAAAALWVISVVSWLLFAEGVRILLLFPAAAAVLIIIFFLYQRPFFYNAVLTAGGLLAVWLYRQHYMNHPRVITACFIGGWVVLAAVAALAFRLRGSDGRLGRLQVLPVGANYMMTWLTCAVTAAIMVLAMVLGVSLSHYLLYVLVAWLFAQAVFFTVKMM